MSPSRLSGGVRRCIASSFRGIVNAGGQGVRRAAPARVDASASGRSGDCTEFVCRLGSFALSRSPDPQSGFVLHVFGIVGARESGFVIRVSRSPDPKSGFVIQFRVRRTPSLGSFCAFSDDETRRLGSFVEFRVRWGGWLGSFVGFRVRVRRLAGFVRRVSCSMGPAAGFVLGKFAMVRSPSLGSFCAICDRPTPKLGSFRAFRDLRSPSLGSFCEICARRARFRTPHRPFLPLVCAPRTPPVQPVFLIIELLEGSLDARFWRESVRWYSPPDPTIVADRPGSPSIAHGWRPGVNWSHVGHSLTDLTATVERRDGIECRSGKDSS